MILGKYQLVISVSVILASAVVALLFDYLKRNNERLREANTELKARRAKELKRLQRANAARSATPMREPAIAAVATAAPSASAMEQGPLTNAAEVTENSSTVLATATQISNSFVPDVTALAESNSELAPAILAAELVALSIDAAGPAVAISALTSKDELPVAAEPAAQSGSRRNWVALLNSARPGAQQPTVASVATNQAKPEVLFLPAGFHSESELRDLLAQNLRVTGLAVSIGANAAEGPALEEVDHLVKSLLQSQDFAAPSAAGEYALIMANEVGASAQRRLNLIAQQLWDFQITSLREQPVALSWGGLEVRNQLLDEALAAAEERMIETRRNRKVLPMELRENKQEWRRRASIGAD